MNFFISDAVAQSGGAAPQSDPFLSLMPLILIFIVFYFLMIRPQMKRQKEHAKLVEALKKGDEITTEGGFLGKIVEVDENFVQVELAKDTVVHLRRKSVTAVMPKGTIKNL
ncbi:MAG: preprotein translocase subunit YajC [Gammaproteobacteria bacterium]